MKMSVSTVKRLINDPNQKFPHVRVNGRKVFSKACWIDQWFLERSHSVNPDMIAAMNAPPNVQTAAGPPLDEFRALTRTLRGMADAMDKALRRR
jgi:hypothetical protein